MTAATVTVRCNQDCWKRCSYQHPEKILPVLSCVPPSPDIRQAEVQVADTVLWLASNQICTPHTLFLTSNLSLHLQQKTRTLWKYSSLRCDWFLSSVVPFSPTQQFVWRQKCVFSLHFSLVTINCPLPTVKQILQGLKSFESCFNQHVFIKIYRSSQSLNRGICTHSTF